MKRRTTGRRGGMSTEPARPYEHFFRKCELVLPADKACHGGCVGCVGRSRPLTKQGQLPLPLKPISGRSLPWCGGLVAGPAVSAVSEWSSPSLRVLPAVASLLSIWHQYSLVLLAVHCQLYITSCTQRWYSEAIANCRFIVQSSDRETNFSPLCRQL